MDTRITVPPVGTCNGKATIVDISDDPVGYHLREAKRLLEELDPELGTDDAEALLCVIDALDALYPEHPERG